MLFRYVGDEPDRLYPSMPLAFDDDGNPTAFAAYTVNPGDVVDVAADPGDGRWAAVTAKTAKTVDVLLPDNHPDRAPFVVEDVPGDPAPAPDPAPALEPPPAPDAGPVADATPPTDTPKGQ